MNWECYWTDNLLLAVAVFAAHLLGLRGFSSLTIVVRRTSVKGEVVSTFPSFRFPELRQLI
jgi:hypothetical protein